MWTGSGAAPKRGELLALVDLSHFTYAMSRFQASGGCTRSTEINVMSTPASDSWTKEAIHRAHRSSERMRVLQSNEFSSFACSCNSLNFCLIAASVAFGFAFDCFFCFFFAALWVFLACSSASAVSSLARCSASTSSNGFPKLNASRSSAS